MHSQTAQPNCNINLAEYFVSARIMLHLLPVYLLAVKQSAIIYKKVEACEFMQKAFTDLVKLIQVPLWPCRL